MIATTPDDSFGPNDLQPSLATLFAETGLPSRSSRSDYNRFLANARPDGDFKYLSNANARFSSENAI
jgi:hypothetical protein